MNIKALLQKFESKDPAACGKLITMVENEQPGSMEVLKEVYHKVGKAHRIGITGPPGAGKSTLVEQLTLELSKQGYTVAIVAVDPSSPFSGGAIMGDRIRMSKLFMDPHVFIRSMATRGSLGGLSPKTNTVCDVLDAFGKDIIIIETVGVGQAELDILQAAFTNVVVLVPESGDGIQAMKAGLMEIGNIFVINKSDRDGADQLSAEIQMMIDLITDKSIWCPQVLKTIATEGKGIAQLLQSLEEHHNYLKDNNIISQKRKDNIKKEIIENIKKFTFQEIFSSNEILSFFEKCIQNTLNGKTTPRIAAHQIWQVWNKNKNNKE